ncbi:MAG: HD domain-containing protein [Chloroflexi bacterium]|nr:MAG: HD domain-containing protein [Chloroflexota bacterium]
MIKVEIAREWYSQNDPVHGFDHVLRVLKLAETIAVEEGADVEVVRAAVLLHDANGEETHTDNGETERLSHHLASAEFAASILRKDGWPEERIEEVAHCIRAHRFRDNREPPQTLEAMIVFDADKLDAIGAIGVARAIAYAVNAGEFPYSRPSEHFMKTGEKEPGERHSAYHEHIYKLRKIRERMFTVSGKRLAEERHRFMEVFFEKLVEESTTE